MVRGKTISEKILSQKSRTDVYAGDVAVCEIDHLVATDGSMPMAIDYFEAMGGTRVWDGSRSVVALDHYSPALNPETSGLHQRIEAFAREHGMCVFGVGEGVGHQLILETGRVVPGSLVIGADSHSVTYGALNCFATGVGSSDLAAAMICGKIWLRVPETILVSLEGQAGELVHAKDAVLALVGQLGADGAAYQAIEFAGSAVAGMSIDERSLFANMSVEMGAKCGLFDADRTVWEYLTDRSDCGANSVSADADASYVKNITLDLGELEPQVAVPHQVDNVLPVRDACDIPIQMVYIGTCAGGRGSDLTAALEVLRAGNGISPDVQAIFTPASRSVMEAASRDGSLDAFKSMGGIVQQPGCGSCCGTCGIVPGDSVNVISTANRNFKGRMGNRNASIYLAAPATCAAAAVRGKITDPREVMA